MDLTKELVERAIEVGIDLFGDKYHLDLAKKAIDDDGKIFKYQRFIGDDLFKDEVHYLSYNKRTDLMRVYSEDKRLLIIVKVSEWKIVESILFTETFYES